MTAVGISVQDVTLRYGEVAVLDQLELRVEPGEIVALLGASGCGKSTLLKAIARLIQPQTGVISFDAESSVRSGGELSYVFQDPTLLPWKTVLQNVCLPFQLGNREAKLQRLEPSDESTVASERAIQVAREALRDVQLPEDAFHKYPSELSGGMRMRTSIARALVTDPSILLLDEPFAALDDILRTHLNELLLELWEERQRTVLFVTHNIAEAVFLSHRIAVLAEGKIPKILSNELAWPRTAEQRVGPQFADMYAAVSRALAEGGC